MNGRDIGLFLDRDGTINEEVDFLATPRELRLIEGSDRAIREANELGLKTFIVTNQSGIARGILTEDRLRQVHENLLGMLKSRRANIDRIYYCPHHPDFGAPPYRADCECRKPKTGMLRQAEKEFHLDLSKSFVVGDRMIDVQTAHAAGATPILVLTGYGEAERELCKANNVRIEHVAENLEEAMSVVRRNLMSSETRTR